ncbi:MAG: hypothetical protein ACRD3W_08465, partial [Terriglobales bacterium]
GNQFKYTYDPTSGALTSIQQSRDGGSSWSTMNAADYANIGFQKDGLPITTDKSLITNTFKPDGTQVAENSAGKTTQTVDVHGNATNYQYDSSGNLAIVQSGNTTWQVGKDSTGATVWSNGTDTFKGTVSVDSQGTQFWKSTDGQDMKFVHADNTSVEFKGMLGDTSSSVVNRDEYGRTTMVTDSQSRMTSFTYGPNGANGAPDMQPLTVNDGKTTFTRSGDGVNATWTPNPPGEKPFSGSLTVDASGNQVWTEKATGTVKTVTADGVQDIHYTNGERTVISSDRQTTDYYHAPDANGNVVKVETGPNDRISVTNPADGTTLTQVGGKVTMTDAQGHPVTTVNGQPLDLSHVSLKVTDSSGSVDFINTATQQHMVYNGDGTVQNIAW